MVRVGHADLGVGPAGQLAAEHEGGDPRQVGLPGQGQQVEHEPGVLAERVGDALRPVDRRELAGRLRRGLPDAPFDVAHRVEILAQLAPVARPQLAGQAVRAFGDRVEQAGVLLQPRPADRRIGAAGVAEQTLEHDTGIVLHRQRRGLVGPRDGVRVGATEPVAARPGEVAAVDRQLQRGELRLPPQNAPGELVHRDAGQHVGAVLRLGRHAGEEARRSARVRAGTGDPVHSGQHLHVAAQRLQRLQDEGELEVRAFRRGDPVLHPHPVGHVDHPEPRDGGRRGLAKRRERRNHPVEERKRQRYAESAQHGAPRERLSGDDHGALPSQVRGTAARLRRSRCP